MTERVQKQLQFFLAREYRSARKPAPDSFPDELLGWKEQATCMGEGKLLQYALEHEVPIFHGEDLFGFNRSTGDVIPLGAWIGNCVPNYPMLLEKGVNGMLATVARCRATADATMLDFYDGVELCLLSCIPLVEKYRLAAKKQGRDRFAKALEQVPLCGARDYYEALIAHRFWSFVLRVGQIVHLPIGRFDQYMKPYFDASLQNGATEEELLELTELYFISLNLDADTFIGMQSGDNGQSMVLGGCDRAGKDAFNSLSEICLMASEELACLIDPKINLRVSQSTPLSLYERGTRLTKLGLGFPQYCNDDIAIPYLVSMGYDLEDARDYAVAACWEFIPSGNGRDVTNRASFSFPHAVSLAVEKDLKRCSSFDEFLSCVKARIEETCGEIVARCNQPPVKPPRPFPLYSATISPCLEVGLDVTKGGPKYNNSGIHGTGISNATDALAAVRYGIFENQDFTPKELLEALTCNFEGMEDFHQRLLSYPKMGNNDDRADDLACFLMDCFVNYLNGKPNLLGGVYRAGTGSALEYAKQAKTLGATADGRFAYDYFSANYSPSLIAKTNGPLSAILSFTKYDLKKICNGGPFTIEVADSVFRNEEGEKKVAMLVKTYIDRGGHQIQINSINREVLLDAKAHPEKHRNLIVRVWGWSGYFNELEEIYQDHIIRRTAFQ